MSRLTPALVVEIREAYARKTPQADIRRQYELSAGAVYKIVHGLSWPNVGGPIVPSGKRQKLQPGDVDAMVAEYDLGATHDELATTYGVCPRYVGQLLRQARQRWESEAAE